MREIQALFDFLPASFETYSQTFCVYTHRASAFITTEILTPILPRNVNSPSIALIRFTNSLGCLPCFHLAA